MAALVAERLAADPRMKEAALLARVKGDPDYRKIQKDVANSLAVAAAAVGEGACGGGAVAGRRSGVLGAMRRRAAAYAR